MPRVLGVGYDVNGDVLDARLAVGAAAVIAIAKLGAWGLALGSGIDFNGLMESLQ